MRGFPRPYHPLARRAPTIAAALLDNPRWRLEYRISSITRFDRPDTRFLRSREMGAKESGLPKPVIDGRTEHLLSAAYHGVQRVRRAADIQREGRLEPARQAGQ